MNYQDILQLIKNKDTKGLEELYLAYGDKFYAYCIQRWHLSEDHAWEVVYKTLETLVLKLSNYDFKSQALFDSFLFKVLVNFLRQHYRSMRNSQSTAINFVDLNNEEEMPYEISKQISNTAFTDYYQNESVENPTLLVLNEALNNLDTAEKDILLLRAQNYTYDEIANYLGIDNNQLKVKHHRAKQKLLSLISEIQKK